MILLTSFHFTESEPAVSGTTLHGLSNKNLHRASCSTVNFVVHHMLQTLIVGGAKENLSIDLSPSVAAVHHLDRYTKHVNSNMSVSKR